MLAAASVRETIDETEDPGTRLILGGILIGLGAAHQIVKTGSLDRAVAEMNEAIEDVLKEKEKK